MGFLRKVEDMYIGHGHLPPHSFLHMTIQEVLAAWHWSSTLCSQELEKLVRRPDLFPLDQYLALRKQEQPHILENCYVLICVNICLNVSQQSQYPAYLLVGGTTSMIDYM